MAEVAPGPIPTPVPLVKFDFVAAQDLVRQLQLTATSLMECAAGMQKVLPETVQDWAGTFRATFDGECNLELTGAAVQVQTLLAQASMIQAKALEAEAQNQLITQHNANLQAPPPGTTA